VLLSRIYNEPLLGDVKRFVRGAECQHRHSVHVVTDTTRSIFEDPCASSLLSTCLSGSGICGKESDNLVIEEKSPHVVIYPSCSLLGLHRVLGDSLGVQQAVTDLEPL
jgi:hypothetical protein